MNECSVMRRGFIISNAKCIHDSKKLYTLCVYFAEFHGQSTTRTQFNGLIDCSVTATTTQLRCTGKFSPFIYSRYFEPK